MHLERLPLFDSESWHDEHLLLCPRCKGNCLHHKKVEFEPTTYATTGNYINIYFDCEFCGEGANNETRLNIRQHKGQTVIEWQRQE